MNALTAEQRELAGRYARLVNGPVRLWAAKCPHLADEVRDAAIDGLIESARLFDPARNVRFATFALYRIRHRIIDAIKKSKAQKRGDGKTVSLEVADFGAVSPLAMEDRHGDWLCEELLALMPVRQREITRLYFLEGLIYREIAERIGLSSTSHVYELQHTSLAELRKHRVVRSLAE